MPSNLTKRFSLAPSPRSAFATHTGRTSKARFCSTRCYPARRRRNARRAPRTAGTARSTSASRAPPYTPTTPASIATLVARWLAVITTRVRVPLAAVAREANLAQTTLWPLRKPCTIAAACPSRSLPAPSDSRRLTTLESGSSKSRASVNVDRSSAPRARKRPRWCPASGRGRVGRRAMTLFSRVHIGSRGYS